VPRYTAFLRGINLGRRRISSDQLCSCFTEMGFTDVGTFRASGNVVFSAEGGGRAGDLAARIEKALAKSLGYEVPTFLRTAAEVKAIAARDPFPAKVVQASRGKLQVGLLSAKPKAPARKQVLALSNDEDRLAIGERELYWLPSGGLSESALDLNAIATLLGPTTVRTKGTIDQIAAKFFAG
jgi:uncharacterized protein (DUF1697 family)